LGRVTYGHLALIHVYMHTKVQLKLETNFMWTDRWTGERKDGRLASLGGGLSR